MIAAADTGPLLYLSLIDQLDLLPQLFEKILVPQAVVDELLHPATPEKANLLARYYPPWLEVRTVQSTLPLLSKLDQGEREAITLALSTYSILLIDDKDAKNVATLTLGIAASGTIGVLFEAAKNDRIPFTPKDFDENIARLLATSFRRSPYLRKTIDTLSRELHDARRNFGSP